MDHSLRCLWVLSPLLVLSALLALGACASGDASDDTGSQGGGDEPAGACVWGLDELLARVDAPVLMREDCGQTNGGDPERVQEMVDCFFAAPDDPGAQFSVNNCIDCLILSHYVSTPDGTLFHVYMESDAFGDSLREARVERCDSIQLTTCVGAEELYACSEPR